MLRLYLQVSLTWKYKAILTFPKYAAAVMLGAFFSLSSWRQSYLLPFWFFASTVPTANPGSTCTAFPLVVFWCYEQLVGPSLFLIPKEGAVKALLRSHSVSINKSGSVQEVARFLQFLLHAFGKQKVVNRCTNAVWLPKITPWEPRGTASASQWACVLTCHVNKLAAPKGPFSSLRTTCSNGLLGSGGTGMQNPEWAWPT